MKKRSYFSNKEKRIVGFILFFLAFKLNGLVQAQNQNPENLLLSLMKKQGSNFEQVLDNPQKFRVQILYTQINRDKENVPSFKSYEYRVNPEEYFYPASSIKLIGAALALEKINGLHKTDLTKDSWVQIDSSYSGQEAVKIDSSSESLNPSMAHYIKKLLVVSDNDAYNRTYEFVGQEELNLKMRYKQYPHLRLTHRLSVNLTNDENRHTNAMTFYSDKPKQIVFKQEAQYSTIDFRYPKRIPLGIAYTKDEQLIESPMDFSGKNNCSIAELQKVLKTIIFPEALKEQERFYLSPDDSKFLLQYMSQLPRETSHPDYAGKPDNYCKFFMYGDDNKAIIPDHVRIFNKIGLAYGFCIDNAYIIDFENNLEFLLTAVIYTNENETLNDGKYEYEEIAFPFLAKLGKTIYDYESSRKREHLPDLSKFKLQYDK